MGIDTKKNTGVWRENRIRYLLTNPTYCGHLRWNYRVNKEQYFEVQNAVPSIIDEETFLKAKEIREGRARVHPRQATSSHVFSGSLRCARCGASMKGHKKTNEKGVHYRSYRCINRYEKKCDMPMISEKILEKVFVQFFEEIKIQNTATPKKKKKEVYRVKELTNELERIKNRRKKWQYAWANELMTDAEYMSRINEENQMEDEITLEINQLTASSSNSLDSDKINIISTYIQDNWEEMSTIEKKTFIQNTVDRIVIEKVEAKKLIDRVEIKELKFR